ncbi:DUF4337 domain-containing protein [Horticoccus luteus]|uniref:DUF4337 domain-containing protein n=1 Tax=Horticoccus luteus TaxID=2862869 RepID=A0A8F9XKP6_9BACT|nr:DUF4337 family protein [Horticoccus luteus]QYM79898.1 DUF4337 domain-containing protein [Horticoccus luteus]
MKITLPADLKSAVPPTVWGRVLSATPVIMTVVATMLAGLASSEMTRAQYDRSLAAQQQSKAGDQWGFFQAKRLRSAIQSGTLDAVQVTADTDQVNAPAMRAFAATLPHPEAIASALDLLLAGRLPPQAAAPVPPPAVRDALAAIENDAPDLNDRLRAAPPAEVAAALRAARDHSRDFDALLNPVVSSGDALGDALQATGPEQRSLRRDFTLLRLRYSSTRYDAEARLNQAVAALYEVQVRQSNLSAERHRTRSQRFFYGMLGAQAAVIIATFAIAARQRNLLWSLAATAGLGALLFAGYVFLFL